MSGPPGPPVFDDLFSTAPKSPKKPAVDLLGLGTTPPHNPLGPAAANPLGPAAVATQSSSNTANPLTKQANPLAPGARNTNSKDSGASGGGGGATAGATPIVARGTSATDDSSTQLYNNLKQLITVVDELRDVGLHNYIDLPRIVAIGSQSSGKSSVIESIAGFDFLPRGEGLCTRRPLELRMKHLSPGDYPGEHAFAIFERTKKRFTNFDDVRQEIERETDAVAGKNKAIIDDPIKLEIHATNAPDLTLIDLPGITLVPLKGSDQNEDIERVTREMTMRYISDQRTIILAVLPGNQDMTTADSLQMAKRVDPQGIRTIGVITKIDIMDAGTDAVKMLKGEEVPLNMGYVGVKLRSQKDINEKKKIKSAMEMEKAWFSAHRLYGKLPPGLTGVPVLIEKLTKILFKHIRHFLPEIKSEIANRCRIVQGRLEELGQGVPLEEREQLQLVWSLIHDYCECFKSTIRGRYDRKLSKYVTMLQETNGGAQIRRIFNEFLIDNHLEKLSDSLSDSQIDTAIRMHEGDSLPGFGNPESFEYLLRPHLQKVKMPAQECVSDVASALDAICQKIAKAVFRRFPKLADMVLQKSQEICYTEKAHTTDIVDNIVTAEIKYRFTNDDEFLCEYAQKGSKYTDKFGRIVDVNEKSKESHHPDGLPDPNDRMAVAAHAAGNAASNAKTAVSNFFTDPNAQKNQRRDFDNNGMMYNNSFVEELRRKLDAFFSLSIRNWRDSIPKSIGFFLVRALEEKMQFELFVGISSMGGKFAEMLGEPPHISDERRSLAAQLKTLNKASDVLQKDPQIAQLALQDGPSMPNGMLGGRGGSSHNGMNNNMGGGMGGGMPNQQRSSAMSLGMHGGMSQGQRPPPPPAVNVQPSQQHQGGYPVQQRQQGGFPGANNNPLGQKKSAGGLFG